MPGCQGLSAPSSSRPQMPWVPIGACAGRGGVDAGCPSCRLGAETALLAVLRASKLDQSLSSPAWSRLRTQEALCLPRAEGRLCQQVSEDRRPDLPGLLVVCKHRPARGRRGLSLHPSHSGRRGVW